MTVAVLANCTTVDAAEQDPVPIKVVIIPEAETTRIRHPAYSTIYNLPVVSPCIELGELIVAELIGPLSPKLEAAPVPMNVDIIALALTLRTLLL